MPQRPYPGALEIARLSSVKTAKRRNRTVARRRRRRSFRHSFIGPNVLYVTSGGDSFSAYLQRMIKLRGISKAELGRRAGVARQTVSEWANQGAPPDLAIDMVVRVARALDDDPLNALRAAAKLPPAQGGDEDVALILAADWSPEVKARMIERLLAARAAEQPQPPAEESAAS